jgi:PAS domain S-box-containing protein
MLLNSSAAAIPYQMLVSILEDAVFVLENKQVVFMNLAAQDLLYWANENKGGTQSVEAWLLSLLVNANISTGFHKASISLEKDGTQRFFEIHQNPIVDPSFHFKGQILLLKEITAQVQIEKSLNAERNFISTILDTMEALMVIIDQGGRIVRINRACKQFFGYSNEEISNKHVWDLIQSQDELTINEMIVNLQAGLSPFQSMALWVTRQGVQKTIAWSNALIRDERNGAQYIVALGIDMTDRERVEGLLEQERLLLRNLIDSIPDLIFYKDVHGIYQGWNRAFRAFRGAKTDAIRKQLTDADLYQPEQAIMFEETDRQVIESGQPVIYENWTTNAQGKPILLETNKTPYFSSDGELLGVIGVGRDITRHRLLENELRAANLEIEQLITSLSSALIAVTSEWKVTRWNPKAEVVLGVQAEKAIGQILSEIEISWDWLSVAAAITRCHQEAQAIFMDPVSFRRSDSNEGFLGINISPIFNDDKKLDGFILLFNDITERKLSERRLAQSQKLASIGQLAAGIAHEINTPIQYIDTNTRFLQQSFNGVLQMVTEFKEILRTAPAGKVSPDILSKVEAIETIIDLDFLVNEIPESLAQTLEGIRRVAEIVQAMKGFSHPGVNKRIPVNLNKSLSDTITIARNTWKYVAEVEMDLSPELPEVICQPGEINQVFLNIIVNAADALNEFSRLDPSRKGVIRLSTHQTEDWVEVRIADNGPGIPSEIRQRIFEPFFTTKEAGKGTGQGLAIAYDIIENKHGGSLTFETSEGQGTTFIIRLPLKARERNGNGREDIVRG